MTLTHLTNARILDGTAPEPTDPVTVVLEGDRIREVSHRMHSADLVVVDGNPLRDLSLLTGQGRHMPLIFKGGEIVKHAG